MTQVQPEYCGNVGNENSDKNWPLSVSRWNVFVLISFVTLHVPFEINDSTNTGVH